MTEFRDAIASILADDGYADPGPGYLQDADDILQSPEMQAIKKALFDALSWKMCMRTVDKILWSRVDMRRAGLPYSVIEWVLEDLTAEMEKGKMTT